MTTRRPSLLSQVRLSDGRLAWPVATAAGMTEPTFRARLNRGLSPDAAVSKPVAKRVPSRAAERARRRAQRAAGMAAERLARSLLSSRRWPERHVSTADGYSGVIWQSPDYRLIVSARGAAYAVQLRCSGGEWQNYKEFPSASILRHWLLMAAIDPAPTLLQAAAGLLMILPFRASPRSAGRPADRLSTGRSLCGSS